MTLEEHMRDAIASRLQAMGVTVAGTHEDPFRRSHTDLATDLAPHVLAAIGKGVAAAGHWTFARGRDNRPLDHEKDSHDLCVAWASAAVAALRGP